MLFYCESKKMLHCTPPNGRRQPAVLRPNETALMQEERVLDLQAGAKVTTQLHATMLQSYGGF